MEQAVVFHSIIVVSLTCTFGFLFFFFYFMSRKKKPGRKDYTMLCALIFFASLREIFKQS